MSPTGRIQPMPFQPSLTILHEFGQSQKENFCFRRRRGAYFKDTIRNTGGVHQRVIMHVGIALCHLRGLMDGAVAGLHPSCSLKLSRTQNYDVAHEVGGSPGNPVFSFTRRAMQRKPVRLIHPYGGKCTGFPCALRSPTRYGRHSWRYVPFSVSLQLSPAR